MRGKKQKKAEQEDGSVWTSNSDLFMALAVVFLVLFVFTLLKSGVTEVKSAVEKAEAQKMLEGQIPEKVQNKADKNLKVAKSTLKNLEKQKETLKRNVEVIAQMVDQVHRKKSVYQQVVKDYEETSALLKVTAHKLKNEKRKTAKFGKKSRSLEKELKRIKHAMASEKAKTDENEKRLSQLVNSLKTRVTQHQEQERTFRKKIKETSENVSKQTKELTQLKKEKERIEEKLKQKIVLGKTKSSKIQELKKEIKNLSSRVDEKSQEIDKQSRRENSLTENLKNSRKEIQKLSLQVKTLKESQVSSDEKLKNASSEIKELKEKVHSWRAQANSGSAELQDMSSQNASLAKELKNMKGQLSSLSKELNQARAENGSLKTKYGKSEARVKGLSQKVGSLEGQVKGLKDQVGGLRGQNRELGEELGKAKGALANSQQRLGQALAAKGAAEKKLGKQLEALKKSKKKQSRRIANIQGNLNRAVSAVSGMIDERRQIAQEIKGALASSGVNVDLDPESGTLTLRMDDVFRFKNNSHALSKQAMETLRKIIPVYSEVLLGKKRNAEKIAGITLTGFASPRYRRKFVDPMSEDREAYEYNLKLSMARAQEIAKYIFGDKIGSYSNKDELRRLISISGKGYMSPVKLSAESTTAKEPCGEYDCAKSRRVEIKFIFKDNKELLSEFRHINRNRHGVKQ